LAIEKEINYEQLCLVATVMIFFSHDSFKTILTRLIYFNSG